MATEAWITIVLADMSQYLADSAMSSLRTAALGVGQTDPFTEHMHSVVDAVRLQLRGKHRNLLSSTPYSIPAGVKNVTCLKICRSMQGRLPGVMLTKGQDEALRDGEKLLASIEEGDIEIPMPPDPEVSPIQGSNATKLVTCGHRYDICDIRKL